MHTTLRYQQHTHLARHNGNNNNTSNNDTLLVIWLHGLGASSHDFLAFTKLLSPAKNTIFILPDAPTRAITINGGARMRAWYDISSLTSLGAGVDYVGIKQSVAQIDQLIDIVLTTDTQVANSQSPLQALTTQDHITHANKPAIIIGGFSQGAVISYASLLFSKHDIAGIIALSGYLPEFTFTAVANPQQIAHNQKARILACHGIYDNVVPLQAGIIAKDTLIRHGYSASWRQYDMAHEVCQEELQDIDRWLKNC